jgi:hypothetical protein
MGLSTTLGPGDRSVATGELDASGRAFPQAAQAMTEATNMANAGFI